MDTQEIIQFVNQMGVNKWFEIKLKYGPQKGETVPVSIQKIQGDIVVFDDDYPLYRTKRGIPLSAIESIEQFDPQDFYSEKFKDWDSFRSQNKVYTRSREKFPAFLF